MARCKLTTMNLRNIRKTREYQCIMIDLVNAGVVSKSAAESILGYTIPAGLLVAGDTGGETGGETSGETGGETTDTVSVTFKHPGTSDPEDIITVDVTLGSTLQQVLALPVPEGASEGDEGSISALLATYEPSFGVYESSDMSTPLEWASVVITEDTTFYIEEDDPGIVEEG